MLPREGQQKSAKENADSPITGNGPLSFPSLTYGLFTTAQVAITRVAFRPLVTAEATFHPCQKVYKKT